MRLVSCATNAASRWWTNSSDRKWRKSIAETATTLSSPPGAMAAAISSAQVNIRLGVQTAGMEFPRERTFWSVRQLRNELSLLVVRRKTIRIYGGIKLFNNYSRKVQIPSAQLMYACVYCKFENVIRVQCHFKYLEMPRALQCCCYPVLRNLLCLFYTLSISLSLCLA